MGGRIAKVGLKSLGYEIAAFGKVAHAKNNKPEYLFDYHSQPRVNLPEHVAEYLAQRESDGPLCLMVGDRRPHVPWTEESLYDPAEVSLPPYFIDTPETRRHRALYYSGVTGLDESMGKVRKMTQEKLGDNVIFLFTSDHGGQWPFGKWNLYDAGNHVPLIVAWPGTIEANARTGAMVSWIDILPTLVELAGGEVPAGIDGQSFAGVLTGKSTDQRSEIYTTHSGDGVMNVYPIRSLRTKSHKYILNLLPRAYYSNHSDILRKDRAGGYWDSWDEAAAADPKAAAIVERYYVRPSEEFYDLQADPLEKNNLATNPAHRQRKEEFKRKLDQWMEAQGDRRTVFNEPYPTSRIQPPVQGRH